MKKEIDQLLEKYLEGETSLEEERNLKHLLSETQDESYGEWKIYFSVVEEERELKIPKAADEALLRGFQSKRLVHINGFGEIKKWMAVAASLLLVFLAGQWAREYEERHWRESLVQDSYESPDKAMEETMKALAYFSDKYQKGKEISSKSMKETKYIDRYFDFNSK